MQAPYRTHRRVEFRDTDAAGIMHFSTYFTYMEQAEHELLRSLGTSVVTDLDGNIPVESGHFDKISWPRVAAECQYAGSAQFENELEIQVSVARIGRSSVTYSFRFLLDQQEIAHGSLTSVCCRFVVGHPREPMPIPSPLRTQLTQLVTT